MNHIGWKYIGRYEMAPFLWGMLLLLTAVTTGAQTRKELENKRDKLLRQIEYTNTLIHHTRKKQKLTVHDLAVIENQIKQRKKLILLLEKETAALNTRTKTLQDSIELLDRQIADTKNKYQILLRRAYINKMTQHPYQFFLSANTVSEAFQNMIYLRQIKRHIAEQYARLQSEQQALRQKQNELQEAVLKKREVLHDSKQQQQKLLSDQKAKEKTLDKLEKREKELRKQLKRKKKERIQLNNAIERIIIQELEASRIKTNKTNADRKNLKLSSDFAANKGKFPWPVRHGTITSRFGRQKHKTLKQVFITNNGIDILAAPGAPVNSIYEGTVAGVASIPGYDRMVVVKHGNYYIVYSRLKEVSVSKGQHIARGAKVGLLNTSGDNAGLLHLEIWKDKTKLNPQKWLR